MNEKQAEQGRMEKKWICTERKIKTLAGWERKHRMANVCYQSSTDQTKNRPNRVNKWVGRNVLPCAVFIPRCIPRYLAMALGNAGIRKRSRQTIQPAHTADYLGPLPSNPTTPQSHNSAIALSQTAIYLSGRNLSRLHPFSLSAKILALRSCALVSSSTP